MRPVTFYFDLGSPYAYLSAERIDRLLPEQVRWQPLLLGGLFKLTGRSSWALGDYRRRQAGMAEIERRAAEYRLPPIRWPDPWPSDYLTAMRVATFAFAAGRGHEFTMQAFRDAFQRGRDLAVAAHVFDVAADAGLDRSEAEDAAQDQQVKLALRDATEAAFQLGVIGVPTLALSDQLFWGDDRMQEAASHLTGMAGRSRES
jgi:2-hydroxychromene-2-carboxylate isomerase